MGYKVNVIPGRDKEKLGRLDLTRELIKEAYTEIVNGLKYGIDNTSIGFKVMYMLKAIAIFSLCRVHDFTRYKVCRNFQDVFYWPDGLCVDMLVIFSFFLLGVWIMYDGYIFCKRCKIKAQIGSENNVILFRNPQAR